jgi:hypothetical protein
MKRQTIAVLVFWAVFLLALGFSGRHLWLRPVWTALLLLYVGALGIRYLVHVVRRRGDPRAMRSCGMPRWWMRFLVDEQDQPPPRR